MKILLLAGEESGMIYANALRKRLAGNEIRTYGDYGFKTSELAVMGFWAVLRRIAFFLRVKRTMEKAVREWHPDIVCTIDYPGMNLKISAYAKRLGIRTMHVVCPQVWAWKAGRIPKIEASTDELCCFLPFEPALFKKGFALFTGHPIAEEFRGMRANVRPGLVAALPGSRLGEIERNLPTMIETAAMLGEDVKVEVPAANDGARAAIARIISRSGAKGISLSDTPARSLLCEASCAMVASGTATLEAAFAHCPTVLVYRVSAALAWFARRTIKQIRHIGLVNIIWEKSGAEGEAPMPELLQEDFTAARTAEILCKWLRNPKERDMAAARLRKAVAPLLTKRSERGGAIEEIARRIESGKGSQQCS